MKGACDRYESFLRGGDEYERSVTSSLGPDEKSVWDKAAAIYLKRMKRPLDYAHPTDLCQKLMWLTRYWQHPLKSQCADKYAVRDYVSSLGLSDILVPLLGVYDRPEEIQFDRLPTQFVLKCNHGCGYNIICLDKARLDQVRAKSDLAHWLKQDYSLLSREAHYHAIRPRIVCETLIQEQPPLECQFWCVNGEPESILACRKSPDRGYEAWAYSLDWKPIDDRIDGNPPMELPRPARLSEMIAAAKRLARPFPFVRVDIYVVEEKIYFAELTFTPAANMLVKYKQEFLDRLGERLVLPGKIG